MKRLVCEFETFKGYTFEDIHAFLNEGISIIIYINGGVL